VPMMTTFKYASNLYHVEMEKGRRNTPSFGRAKEVGGSIFEFAAFSEQEPLTLPRWVRLGLWRSKAALTWEGCEDVRLPSGRHTVAFPLNPLDVASHFMVFDLLSMPPVSLRQHAQMEGEYYELPNGLQFPVDMQYFKTPFPAVRGTPR
jgi:CRISPR-associated protein Csc1